MKITKLITISFASLLFSQISQSQTNGGHFYIGGETNLNFSLKTAGITADNQPSEDQTEFTNFSITPKIGMFTTDELLLGISIPIGYSNTEYLVYSEERSSKTLMVAPFIQYYLSNSKIKPFLFGTAGIGTITYEEKSTGMYQSNSEKSTNGLAKVAGGLGMAVFMNDFLSLDFLLQYEYLARTPDGENPNNLHGYTKGFEFKFGISGYL